MNELGDVEAWKLILSPSIRTDDTMQLKGAFVERVRGGR